MIPWLTGLPEGMCGGGPVLSALLCACCRHPHERWPPAPGLHAALPAVSVPGKPSFPCQASFASLRWVPLPHMRWVPLCI